MANAPARAPDAQPARDRLSDLEAAHATLHDMDSMQQGATGEIAAIAQLALCAMENPRAWRQPELLAAAFMAIVNRATDLQNVLNCEAERHGCNFVNEAAQRRWDAFRAARSTGGAAHGG